MASAHYRNANEFQAEAGRSLVLIGNFDGVHRGHQQVLESAVGLAHQRHERPVLLTFDPHPAHVLGRADLPLLTNLEFKLELLRKASPELALVVHPFTHELSRQTPREFVTELLLSKLAARLVMVGEDFRFGCDRQGDFDQLKALGSELGFDARAMPLIGDARGPYSSSRVRKALAQGDLEEVRHVLGRRHALSGMVVPGDARGRTIGVPTANLANPSEALPSFGVYAVLVDELSANGPVRIGGGVANIGTRPTFDASFSLEVHILDFDGDLYGKRLRLHLVEKLRDQKRFDSLSALSAQLQLDMAQGRAVLKPLLR